MWEIAERETQTCLCLRRASGRKEKLKTEMKGTNGIRPREDKRKRFLKGVSKLEKGTEVLISLSLEDRRWLRFSLLSNRHSSLQRVIEVWIMLVASCVWSHLV